MVNFSARPQKPPGIWLIRIYKVEFAFSEERIIHFVILLFGATKKTSAFSARGRGFKMQIYQPYPGKVQGELFHPLAFHLLDAAAMMQCLLRQKTPLVQRLA